MSEPRSTSQLLADLRAALSGITDATVLPRLGDEYPAARDRTIRIVSVESEAEGADLQREYIRASRRVTIEARAVAVNSTDGSASDFFDAVRHAVMSRAPVTSFGSVYAVRFDAEPVALGRDSGYYTYTLRVTAQRALTVE